MFSTLRLESATPTSSGRPVTPGGAAFTAVISWKISRRTVSPSLICGVTRSVTPMSWRSTFWPTSRGSLLVSSSVVSMPDADCTRLEMIGMFVADLDLRLLVVGGEDVRRREDVRAVDGRARRGSRPGSASSPVSIAAPPRKFAGLSASSRADQVCRDHRVPARRRRLVGSSEARCRSRLPMRVTASPLLRDAHQPAEAEVLVSLTSTSMISASTSTCGARDVELRRSPARACRKPSWLRLDHERVGRRIGGDA